MRWLPNPDEVNHRLESRVREIRSHGSEGGGRKAPYPYPLCRRYATRTDIAYKPRDPGVALV